MNTEGFKRKLSAILSADVVGYSRLMGEDEEFTIRTLSGHREMMSTLIRQHQGRVVDSPGDNLLAEFESVTRAVDCAVEIQREMTERNEELPDDRKMEYRIGVNIGDVIEEGDRIYGDGVNIAARLESLAEPGGICISDFVYKQVRNRLKLEYEFVGDQSVKNIKEPVPVYRVLSFPGAAAHRIIEAKETAEKSWRNTVIIAVVALVVIFAALVVWHFYPRGPSIEPASIEPEQAPAVSEVEEAPKTIAVLPFVDMSPDKDQDYFSDGTAEELLNQLAKLRGLHVAGRTSSFYFKGKTEEFQVIGEKLDVAYILEGSVRKSGNQLRITAQLIKAEDGYHLWSETYDRELVDIFTIQDEIAAAVTTALGVTLGAGDFGRPGMTRNIEAYDEYLRAVSLINESNLDSRLPAIDQAERVVSIDPSYGLGWLAVRSAYIGGILLLPPEQTTDFQAKVVAALEHARAIAPDMPELLVITAGEHMANGNWLEAERNLRQLLDQYGHSNEAANLTYGDMLLQVGRLREALPFLQRAQRLEPLSAEASWILSVTLLSLGRIEEAVAEAKRGLTLGGYELVLNGIEWVAAFSVSDRHRAAEIIETFYNMEGDNPDEYMLRLAQLLVSEDTEAALSEVRSMVADPTLSPFNKVLLISFAAVLGDPELALDIYREYGLDNYRPLWFNLFSDMRQLPGFKTFVSDAGLVDYWRNTGHWGDFCRPVGDDDFVCD